MNAVTTTAPLPDGVAAGPPYRCGTLTYTKAGLALVFFWLLWGDFCFTLMESVIPSIMPLRLEELHAPNLVMSLIVGTIPNAMNFLVNPVVSFRSDRHRGKWGRRIPFLLFPTPFITLCLVGMAYSAEIGQWLHTHVVAGRGGFGVNAVIIGTIAVLMVTFQFFNMFISSVYYYLFNDVVPAQFVSRFMAFFRLVGSLAGMCFSYFIFPFAKTHLTEIFLGAAVLYFIGFMLMCWRVREGEYPPAPPLVDNRTGFLASAKTYLKESYTHPFYLCFFGFGACLQVSGACAFVANLFYLHLGISLAQIGKFGAIMSIPGLILMWPIGWLADRFHPVRVVVWSMLWFPLLSLLSFFVVHDFKTMVIMSLVGFPIGMFYGAAVLPMQMLLMPKERYGQFGSADAVIRSISAVLMSVVAGLFMDWLSRLYGGNKEYYRWMYIWSAICQVASWLFLFRVYRYWKQYGGLKNYKPPAVGAPVGGTTL
jgi:maltose/moltooligosaccharide transporter